MSEMNEKTQKLIERAMTVGELIRELIQFDESTPVVFAYNSGDFWGQDICDTVEEISEEGVKWSSYHNTITPINSNDDMWSDDNDDDDEAEATVVLIKG